MSLKRRIKKSFPWASFNPMQEKIISYIDEYAEIPYAYGLVETWKDIHQPGHRECDWGRSQEEFDSEIEWEIQEDIDWVLKFCEVEDEK